MGFEKSKRKCILKKERIAFKYGMALKFNPVQTPRIGNICTDGQHIEIVSGKSTTISASTLTNTIVENDWGFRGNTAQAAAQCEILQV
ncbi:MAG: hypothetical protein E7048_09570 [Lentisphaerae bacterium]|nr:hypothetical protein [Lentisphaerota bacterium]